MFRLDARGRDFATRIFVADTPCCHQESLIGAFALRRRSRQRQTPAIGRSLFGRSAAFCLVSAGAYTVPRFAGTIQQASVAYHGCKFVPFSARRAAYPEGLRLPAYRSRVCGTHLNQPRGDRCDGAVTACDRDDRGNDACEAAGVASRTATGPERRDIGAARGLSVPGRVSVLPSQARARDEASVRPIYDLLSILL